MNREEIINQGRPTEPHCFETDREEQWYKVGLYNGATATANPWHSVADGDLPESTGEFLCDDGYLPRIGLFRKKDRRFYDPNSRFYERISVDHWMEIPKLPAEQI